MLPPPGVYLLTLEPHFLGFSACFVQNRPPMSQPAIRWLALSQGLGLGKFVHVIGISQQSVRGSETESSLCTACKVHCVASNEEAILVCSVFFDRQQPKGLVMGCAHSTFFLGVAYGAWDNLIIAPLYRSKMKKLQPKKIKVCQLAPLHSLSQIIPPPPGSETLQGAAQSHCGITGGGFYLGTPVHFGPPVQSVAGAGPWIVYY